MRTAPSVPADLERLCMALLRVDAASRPSADACSHISKASAERSRVSLSPPTTRSASSSGVADELAALREAWTQSSQGTPSRVVVEGESGLGKSALVQQFTKTLELDSGCRSSFAVAATSARSFATRRSIRSWTRSVAARPRRRVEAAFLLGKQRVRGTPVPGAPARAGHGPSPRSRRPRSAGAARAGIPCAAIDLSPARCARATSARDRRPAVGR